jgi:hypothetical protein
MDDIQVFLSQKKKQPPFPFPFLVDLKYKDPIHTNPEQEARPKETFGRRVCNERL